MNPTTPSTDDFPVPKFIEGGCLCAALRYRVDFPENHDFRKRSCTCQCTQCRKQSGSLFWSIHQVTPASAFKWTSESDATLKIYRASPAGERVFCSDCGSWITWKSTDESQDFAEFAVGTVDQIYLIGDGVEKVHAAADGDGQQIVPKNGFGFALASGSGTHFWTENEIVGVTDDIPCVGGGRGKKLLQQTDGEKS